MRIAIPSLVAIGILGYALGAGYYGFAFGFASGLACGISIIAGIIAEMGGA